MGQEYRITLSPLTPIYEQLVRWYRESILTHQLLPGDRIDSITEIQRRHGVSRETAKRVLRILEEEGLIVQRAGKGSYVADLRPKQNVWGLVFPFHCLQYDDMILRLSQSAASQDRELRYFCDYNNWEEEVRLVSMMLAERYEAVIVIPTFDESKTWTFYSCLSPFDSPVLLLDHTMTYQDFTFVIQSYDLGVVRAMDYLRSRDSGSIAFLGNASWAGRNMVLELMQETYREYLRTRRSDMQPLIISRPSQITSQFIKEHDVTGVFCCDDVSAIQMLGRLREQGLRAPDELSVVSYGNTDLARFFTPGITSVDPHNDEMVELMEQLLTTCIKGNRPELTQYVIQPDLVVRET